MEKKKLNAPFEFRLFWFFPNLTSMSPTKKTIDVQLLVRNQPNAGGPWTTSPGLQTVCLHLLQSVQRLVNAKACSCCGFVVGRFVGDWAWIFMYIQLFFGYELVKPPIVVVAGHESPAARFSYSTFSGHWCPKSYLFLNELTWQNHTLISLEGWRDEPDLFWGFCEVGPAHQLAELVWQWPVLPSCRIVRRRCPHLQTCKVHRSFSVCPWHHVWCHSWE